MARQVEKLRVQDHKSIGFQFELMDDEALYVFDKDLETPLVAIIKPVQGKLDFRDVNTLETHLQKWLDLAYPAIVANHLNLLEEEYSDSEFLDRLYEKAPAIFQDRLLRAMSIASRTSLIAYWRSRGKKFPGW